jgi:hypothetical protein
MNTSPTPEQLAQYVAVLIDDAAAAYQEFASTAPSIMASKELEMDSELFAVLRALGSEIGVTLANANRLIDEVMSRHQGVANSDDPRYLQQLLRALEDSFVLLISVHTRQDLLGRPLLHPTKLENAMSRENVRRWLDLNKTRNLPEGPLVAVVDDAANS